jgi:glycosyltransferase involved in cell wall biosynthesis
MTAAGTAAIAQVVLSLRTGGLERVVVDLVNHVSPEFKMLVVCLEDRGVLGGEIRAPTAAVVELNRRPGFRPSLALRLGRVLRIHRAELVHTHNTAAAFYGALAGRICGIPVLHTKHGANLAGSPRQGWLNRLAYTMTDHVVAVSGAARELARGEGAREAALCVIDNGVDLTRFKRGLGEMESSRAELGIPSAAFVIGCVARLAAEKNQRLLIEAFSALPDDSRDRPPWLALVGDGPLRESLRASAASASAGPRIVFAGARADVARLLPAFDVFVLSSDSEGLPVALLEAMAAGVPPVVTRVGAMPEVLSQGEAGLLVDPGDREGLIHALARLRSDEPLRTRLATAALARVRDRYDARRMAQAYEGIYSRLMSRGSR